MIVAIFTLSALAGASGLLLGFAAVRFKVEGDPVVEKIEAMLPQSQCGQCGYVGCPVSYTHLDVYKRQGQKWALIMNNP